MIRALLVAVVVAVGLVGVARLGGTLRTGPEIQNPTDAQATNVRRTVVSLAYCPLLRDEALVGAIEVVSFERPISAEFLATVGVVGADGRLALQAGQFHVQVLDLTLAVLESGRLGGLAQEDAGARTRHPIRRRDSYGRRRDIES